MAYSDSASAMNNTFETLPWHDAELLEVTVDRRKAGECDEVRMRVAWPQGDEAALVFRGCYAMISEMSFGVIATERIGSGEIVVDDDHLASIQERWKSLGVSLVRLRCYRIEMSSTGSVIRVFAERFDVE